MYQREGRLAPWGGHGESHETLDVGHSGRRGSRGGLMRASIAFDHVTVVPNTQSRSITGVAIGPADVWYADHRCIYKTAL